MYILSSDTGGYVGGKYKKANRTAWYAVIAFDHAYRSMCVATNLCACVFIIIYKFIRVYICIYVIYV